jgi:hypothetical protein
MGSDCANVNGGPPSDSCVRGPGAVSALLGSNAVRRPSNDIRRAFATCPRTSSRRSLDMPTDRRTRRSAADSVGIGLQCLRPRAGPTRPSTVAEMRQSLVSCCRAHPTCAAAVCTLSCCCGAGLRPRLSRTPSASACNRVMLQGLSTADTNGLGSGAASEPLTPSAAPPPADWSTAAASDPKVLPGCRDAFGAFTLPAQVDCLVPGACCCCCFAWGSLPLRLAPNRQRVLAALRRPIMP